MYCPIAGYDLLLSNRLWSNTAKPWLPAYGCAHAFLFLRIRWVQCAVIFLTDSFPPHILISHAFLTFVHHSFLYIPRHASKQCLSICPSNFCHMIACATYIISNISKPTRMSKPAHLENYFDKPQAHSDSYSIHNVTEQHEHSPMQLAIDVLYFNPCCS